MKEMIRLNSYYEGLIQNLFGSSKGCFSNFMTFFYQYNQVKEFSPENVECMKFLYKAELENCEILSQVLIFIGGDNRYFASSRKYLSGFNVDYCKAISKMFVCDVELLEIGIIEVKNALQKIENKTIKEKLKKIIYKKKNELKLLKETFFKNNMLKKQ